MEFDKKYIAQVIQNARKQKGLKQSQLAEMVGISEKHLSKIETGNNYPALDNFLKIVTVLNLSLKDFGLNDDIQQSPQKIHLQKLINTSTEKQLDIYSNVIDVLKKYV
ncbi:helix-turn-helix transcriptional regulator [bacterium]|nr:helix-turn-helix transcriptional regulator [bacterium]